uniref:Protein kinase domain-containing protein n=1 Tax=Panagrolaimus sp. PS1159 TaxID=55785 RepID=A0AC35GNR8_9BILA
MGWTIFANTPALMTELADTNLLTYIQKNQNTPLKTILSILLQISQALEFIAEQGIIHRDVACRNILIIFDENNIIAKLADFGLCCLFGDTLTPRNSIYKRFPIKWLSIEALINCEFSEKSDVWAFGILCYETFSLGAVPYSDMSNSEMIEFLQSGQRLKCPMKTPHLIYDLMQNCWKKEPKDRPKFNEISFHLRSMLEKETANYGYLNLKTSSLKIIHI